MQQTHEKTNCPDIVVERWEFFYKKQINRTESRKKIIHVLNEAIKRWNHIYENANDNEKNFLKEIRRLLIDETSTETFAYSPDNIPIIKRGKRGEPYKPLLIMATSNNAAKTRILDEYDEAIAKFIALTMGFPIKIFFRQSKASEAHALIKEMSPNISFKETLNNIHHFFYGRNKEANQQTFRTELFENKNDRLHHTELRVQISNSTLQSNFPNISFSEEYGLRKFLYLNCRFTPPSLAEWKEIKPKPTGLKKLTYRIKSIFHSIIISNNSFIIKLRKHFNIKQSAFFNEFERIEFLSTWYHTSKNKNTKKYCLKSLNEIIEKMKLNFSQLDKQEQKAIILLERRLSKPEYLLNKKEKEEEKTSSKNRGSSKSKHLLKKEKEEEKIISKKRKHSGSGNLLSKRDKGKDKICSESGISFPEETLNDQTKNKLSFTDNSSIANNPLTLFSIPIAGKEAPLALRSTSLALTSNAKFLKSNTLTQAA